MFATLLARTAHLTAATIAAGLLTAYVTIIPVPAQATTTAAVAAHR